MASDLLVAGRYQRQSVLFLMHGVKKADIAVPTDAEDIRNVFLDQSLDNELPTLLHCLIRHMARPNW